MSVKSSLLIAGIAVVGIGAFMAAVPGSPVWRIFNPTKTVTLLDQDGSVAASPGADVPLLAGTRELEIVSLLPEGGIPAIFDPEFLEGDVAQAQMSGSDRVIGLSVNGDHHAYSIAHLSSHEIVNDTVGGVPVAITW